MNISWKKINKGPGQSLANLYVAVIPNGLEIGMIQKPVDSDGCKNAWRAFDGIGDRARFVGHAWSMGEAKALVLKSIGV